MLRSSYLLEGESLSRHGTTITSTSAERVVTEKHYAYPDEERRIREAALDETVAGSFPASDPASSLPNPDEHDAEGSGVEPAAESRSKETEKIGN